VSPNKYGLRNVPEIEELMTLKHALTQGIQILRNANIEAPASNAGVILCNVLNCDKTFIYVHHEHILKELEIEEFFSLIESRAKGKPLQYITGHQEFMSLDFFVSPEVLIPRHDTETLVETVLEYSKLIEAKEIKILEIGTGSGCISVSLAHYIDKCEITAVDASGKALEVAGKNALNIGVNNKIKFLLSSLFENIDAGSSYDIIVSNPPYIPSEDIKGLQTEVKEFEPVLALDGGADGLDFYRHIIDRSPFFQKPGGILAFEVGYNQSAEVAKYMKKAYNDIKVIEDLSKIGRVVVGRLEPVKRICF
jgi:release factor glutamine methyltransferase